MNKRLLWTTAALLTAVGIPLSSYAESVKPDHPYSQTQETPSYLASTAHNVVKVGEYQSATENKVDNTVVARIKPHEIAGKQAATIYVRNIPVITFLETSSQESSSSKANKNSKQATSSSHRVATAGNLTTSGIQSNGSDNLPVTNAPVWRATAVAAKLNQLSLGNLDSSKITVSWKAGDNANKTKERYSLKLNDKELVELNSETRLPDKTDNLGQEALQVANRLRRLLGNAPPLREIAGMPKPKPQTLAKLPKSITLGPVRLSLNGMASWYGPGFHGNRTASGEVYNQHGLTAAHRSLPFGTKVRVTNVRSGRSVVVRITDRGPFIRGRILDLSAAAARMIGVVSTGVAPVRVEVLR